MGKNLKTILAVIGLLLIVGGTAAAIILVRQRQEIRKKAAVEGGEATANLSPTSITKDVNVSFPVQVNFNTNGVAISGISVRLNYSYTESEPPIRVEGDQIQINTTLLTSGDWSCPVKQASNSGGKYLIDISCINTNVNGYTAATDTLLASFNLVATKVPEINPIELAFNPQQSIITKKTDAQDTLLIPTSKGVYTITGDGAGGEGEEEAGPCDLTFNVGVIASPTPTSTSAPTATVTPTPTATSAPEPTATPVPGAAATPTPQPTPTSVAQVIPTPTIVRLDIEGKEPGFTLPTIGAILGGIVLIVGSLLLFF